MFAALGADRVFPFPVARHEKPHLDFFQVDGERRRTDAAAGGDHVAGVTVRAALETLFSGRASLYIGLLFVAFVLYVPNGLLGTVRDRIGGRFVDRPWD